MAKRCAGLAAMLAAVVLLGACGGSGSSGGSGGGGSIVLGANGGSYDQCQQSTFIPAFKKATGMDVKYGSFAYDLGAWKAQQESGAVEWDVAVVDASEFDALRRAGWLEPLGVSTKGMLDFPGVSVDNYGIASEIFSQVVTYRADKFGGDPPKTWADVFNTKKYPGKRMFHRNAADMGTLEMALLADGVAPKDLYPLDVNRALRKLDSIKNDIIWYDNGTKMVALIQQGEAVIGAGWDGRIKDLQAQTGGNVVGMSPEQAIARPDYWVIPKGAKNPEGARKFLRFITQPKQQAAFAKCTGYPPPWVAAFDHLPNKSSYAVTPDKLHNVIVWNSNYWKANRDAVTQRFNAWLGGS
ncbi:MAG: ABC transporter substrate-binding protein [Actinobacteria bacterium]|nr:ABC transporter substrate-binding protein [Actinomycetota bacterium]